MTISRRTKLCSFAGHSRAAAQPSQRREHRPLQYLPRGAQRQRAGEHKLPRDVESPAQSAAGHTAVPAAATAAATK